MKKAPTSRNLRSYISTYFWITLGAFLAAFSIEVFFFPNQLIDGGIVGLSMILGNMFGKDLIPIFLICLNAPFLYLAMRSIGHTFLLQMFISVLLFSGFLSLISHSLGWEFHGETIEVVVIGGALLGIGIGLIIRAGGGLDGTEVLGIVLNKKLGFTVGQVVLSCNIFVFGAAGIVFQDWHPPILSLITYMVVIKVMDTVIVGLDETKSVMVISRKAKEIGKEIVHELGLGLTVLYGRGGFSGADRELLYVTAERLQLAELKELILNKDPLAFIAIQNLHEVANGMQGLRQGKGRTSTKKLFNKLLGSTSKKKSK